MILSEEVKKEIALHSLIEHPKECCGFVIFHNFFQRMIAVRATNTAENKLNHVNYDGKEILNIKYLGKILALYHSHNSENSFSEIDKKCYNLHEIPIALYNIPTKKFSVYQGENHNNKYINREFVIGKSDCYNLIMDYYLNELGIVIPDFLPARNDDWHKNGINYIDKYINSSQLVKIAPSSLRPSDIIVLDYKNNRFHFGIYLDNDCFLHQPRNKKSLIEIYSNKYKNITIHGLRSHKFNTI